MRQVDELREGKKEKRWGGSRNEGGIRKTRPFAMEFKIG